MEFKNLERTRFNWFATKEIKDLDLVEYNLPFITKFSFGPFVPYYLYNIFHNCWDLLILEFVAGSVVGIIGFLGGFFYGLSSELSTSSVSKIDFSTGKDLYSGDSAFLSYYPYLIVFIVLILIVIFGIKIYQCINCRRLSWNRCEWKDYESFEMGEKNWNIAGLVFFVLQMISLLVVISLLIFLYLNLAGAHY